YDDLADFFGQENRIGKTLGTDLLSGKLTLPLQFLAERLPEEERAGLMEEILGQRTPDLRGRIEQMARLGVFEAVSEVIHHELRTAESALAPHGALAPVPLLQSLADVLRSQVAALRAGVGAS